MISNDDDGGKTWVNALAQGKFRGYKAPCFLGGGITYFPKNYLGISRERNKEREMAVFCNGISADEGEKSSRQFFAGKI